MEIYYFFFIYLATFLSLVFTKKSTYDVAFYILWWLIALTLSLILRSYINYDRYEDATDIDFYLTAFADLEANVGLASKTKEFIWWSIGGYLYDITGSGKVVIFIIDVLIFFFFFRSFLNIRKTLFPSLNNSSTRFLLLGFLLFFAFTSGMTDHIRQLLASAILLYSITKVLDKKFIRAILFFLIALFIHSSTILFFPLLLFMSDIRKYKFFAVILIAIIPITLNLFLYTDFIYSILNINQYKDKFALSMGFVGETIAYYYLLIFCVLALTLIMMNKFSAQNKLIFQYVIILFLIYAACVFVIPSEPAERLAKYVCILLFPVVGYFFEVYFSNKILIRIIYLHFSLLPLIHYTMV
jgi:hypothetical protein